MNMGSVKKFEDFETNIFSNISYENYIKSDLSLEEYIKKYVRNEIKEVNLEDSMKLVDYLSKKIRDRIINQIVWDDMEEVFVEKIIENPKIYIDNKSLIQSFKFYDKLPEWIKRSDKTGLWDLKK
jgi:hypothetical protein